MEIYYRKYFWGPGNTPGGRDRARRYSSRAEGETKFWDVKTAGKTSRGRVCH
jgi:hypothetical protein